MRTFHHRPILYTPFAVFLAAACATGSAETPGEAPSSSSPPQHVRVLPPPPEVVEEVVDSRTVVLSNGVKAQVLGLAAPGACWSEAALKFAKDTLQGKPVHYSRASESAITLRLADDSEYAFLAVSQGAARAEKDDPVLTEPEKAAARIGLGLWGPPCNGQDTTTAPAPPPAPPATTSPPPPAKKGCSATYHVLKEWTGGFHAELTVRNHDDTPVTKWSVRWKFSSGQQIKETFGMTARQFGPDVVGTSQDGNGSISAGGEMTARFNVSTAAPPGPYGPPGPPGPNVAPTAFTLNGKACSLD